MSEKKLLAEWFWIDRWDGSSAAGLPLEARGLYREMLSQAWRRGAALPIDLTQIRRLVRCTQQEWKRAWPLVSRYWRQEGDVLVNDTQREIYTVALAASEVATERGRRAAQAKHKHHSSTAQAVLEHNPPSPSPISDSKDYLVGRKDSVSGNDNGYDHALLPALPLADRTAKTIREKQDAACTQLLALVGEMTPLDPQGRDVTEIMQLVTGYTKPDGRKVSGVINPALLTYERVLKSIEDAEWQYAEWKKGVPSPLKLSSGGARDRNGT